MRTFALRIAALAALFCGQPFQPEALAWHDKTHLSVAEAAGFELWYSAAAPDVAKSKEMFEPFEKPNHFFNNTANKPVTPDMVMKQAGSYNKPCDEEGHIYGAIIGSVREYQTASKTGKYANYPLVFCAHYCGDLSMPLHNTTYDDFNKERHSVNDGIIENSVRGNIAKIQSMMTPPVIQSEADLVKEIAAIAESARLLGLKMRQENRNMTPEEAYTQVARSASLLKAILAWSEKPTAVVTK
ncbi:MAG: hypothetical protein HGB15_00390 [Chlorobaculum sp.]|nr:hypothetical protein [Chlorobaculum sp.]